MIASERFESRAIALGVLLSISAHAGSARAETAPPHGAKVAAAATPTATFGPPPAGDLPLPPQPKPLAEALVGDAKRDYDAALILYQSGDFAGAGLKFQAAFDTSGDIRLLWNEAACQQALRHYAKAIVLVRRYLASHSPLITPDAEHNAVAFLDAALPLTARILLEVSDEGANVYVDDESVGKTPLDAETRVDFGTHRLIVKKEGFEDAERTITVTTSEDIHYKLMLAPIVHQGRLVVRAGKGDNITLDGRFVAAGTYDGPVASGSHLLRVSATGARPFESPIVIEDNRTRAMDVALEPAPVSTGIPTWVWIAGGSVLAAGLGTAGYFIFKSSGSEQEPLPQGTAHVQLPLGR
jgi:hypothetical protein